MINQLITYKEVAHTSMEAEKSQDPSSASQRSRRADVIAPVQKLADFSPKKN